MFRREKSNQVQGESQVDVRGAAWVLDVLLVWLNAASERCQRCFDGTSEWRRSMVISIFAKAARRLF